MQNAHVKWTELATAAAMAFALVVAQVPVAGASSSGGNAISVGANACSRGHGVDAADCSYYTSGGKVTVCHFEDHVGDIAVATAADCSNEE